MTDSRGYIALAAIVLSKGEPFVCMVICLLYGMADAVVIMLSSQGVSAQLLSTIPYVMAIAVAIAPAVIKSVTNRHRATQIKHQIVASGYDK